MRKIPTLFKREFFDHKVVNILPEVTPGFEWVLNGGGMATLKLDGACCAIIDGELYKRYDAKRGKTPPAGALPCEPAPDPVTGHWPCWVKCDKNNPSDKWFIAAYKKRLKAGWPMITGTYEAIGLHFNGNPYRLDKDYLIMHGTTPIPEFPRDFEGIREYLRTHVIEGVVFWKDCEPQCKIKRTDFGFEWPIKEVVPNA